MHMHTCVLTTEYTREGQRSTVSVFLYRFYLISLGSKGGVIKVFQ